MTKISALVSLRKVLLQMEQDLGLKELAPSETDVLYAAHDSADQNDLVTTRQIQSHKLAQEMPRASFFRALSALEEAGELKRPEQGGRGLFKVRKV